MTTREAFNVPLGVELLTCYVLLTYSRQSLQETLESGKAN